MGVLTGKQQKQHQLGGRDFYLTRERSRLSPVSCQVLMLKPNSYSCRDTNRVVEAVYEARKGTAEGDERALQLLSDSQADIKRIVSSGYLTM